MKWRCLLVLFCLWPASLWSQAWSPILDPSRAIDWTQNVGLTVPTVTVPCSTQPTGLTASSSSAASANATIINNAIASCDPTHNVINLPVGTYYVTFIKIQVNKVVLRGAGPNSTLIIPTTGTGCAGGQSNGICAFQPNNVGNQSAAVLPPSGTQQCTAWTGGLAQGSTSLTFTGCGGTPAVGKLIILDQANDTADTSGIYICNGESANCAVDGAGNNNGRSISSIIHSEQQVSIITGVTSLGGGSFTVTIPAPGIINTNIRSGQSPSAWWFDALTNVGIENLSIDGTTMSSGAPTNFGNIGFLQCNQCWVQNVRTLNAGRYHIEAYLSYRSLFRNNYVYGALNSGTSSYAVEFEAACNSMVENNIIQQTVAPIMMGTGCSNVIGYNFGIGGVFTPSNTMNPASTAHNAGNNMNLFEGNNFNGIWGDDTWGSSGQDTMFRNMLIGWQHGNTQATVPILYRSFVRGMNIVGNVLGQPGYHTQYQTIATSTSTGTGAGAEWTSIYDLGWAGTGPSCSVATVTTCDPLVVSTLMRWGNYDTVTAGTKFDTAEASPGAVTFLNANFTSTYFSSLAHTLPASLYYGSTPSWWPSGKAWPATGPDVSTGNVGTCSGTYSGSQATSSAQCTGGTKSTAWASHVTSLPAQDCYLALGGPPDGSGSALAFDAGTCYSAAPPAIGNIITTGLKMAAGVAVQ